MQGAPPTGTSLARAQRHDGMTPLMFASKNGHSNVVAMLLQAGAKTETRSDGSGQMTALLLAAQGGLPQTSSSMLGVPTQRHALERT